MKCDVYYSRIVVKYTPRKKPAVIKGKMINNGKSSQLIEWQKVCCINLINVARSISF